MIIDIKHKTDQLNREFGEFLNDKSVAILGRGMSIQSLSGKYIDSFDVVVRIHKPVPSLPGNPDGLAWQPPPFVPTTWQSIVGKRTDIYYDNLGHPCGLDFIEQVIDAFKVEGGKFWCVESPYHYISRLDDKQFVAKHIDVRVPSLEFYDSVKFGLLGGASPLEGTLVVADILQYDIKCAFIAGMDCFCDEDNPPRKESVRMGDRYVDKGANFFFLRDLWKKHDNITVDKVMESLFNKYKS